MRVTTSLTSDDLAGTGARAAAVEAAGYDGVNSQENKHDPFVPLTLAAAATERIELATGVAISFPRSPMMAAQVAWDLQLLSKGRFTLGLGTQIRPHNERRFSTPWIKPAARMREYVESVQAIFECWATGERLRYEGEHYTFTLMTPNFVPPPLEGDPPKVSIAAVGPLMLNVAASVCDGVMLHGFCTQKYLDEVILPKLQAGLDARGLSRSDFEITGGGFVATGTTQEDVNKVREWVRQRIGFYGSTPSYWPVFEIHGLTELGPKLNAMSKAGEWDAMTQEIDDDLIELFCASGTHDVIADRIADHFGDRVDSVSLDANLPPETVAAIQAM